MYRHTTSHRHLTSHAPRPPICTHTHTQPTLSAAQAHAAAAHAAALHAAAAAAAAASCEPAAGSGYDPDFVMYSFKVRGRG